MKLTILTLSFSRGILLHKARPVHVSYHHSVHFWINVFNSLVHRMPYEHNTNL